MSDETHPTIYVIELEIEATPTRRYIQLANLIGCAQKLGFTLASEPKEISS